MTWLTVVVGLTGLVSLGDAIPSSQKHGFSVNQVASGRRIARDGPKAYQQAFIKYNVPVPAPAPARVAAPAALQSGSVGATPQANDKEYLSPVQIGTPPQTVMMSIDTGSSDFWVFSSLQSTAQTANHTIYTISKSSSAVQVPNATWKIRYVDGSGASGVVYNDTVSIGGVVAKPQAVECAKTASATYVSDTANSGTLGLAAKSLNRATPKVATFFDNVRASLPSPLFAAYLKKAAPGSFDFGFINSTKFSGKITYAAINTTVSDEGYFQIQPTGYTIQVSNGTQYKTHAYLPSIVDTGSSLLYMPDAAVKKYYKFIANAEYNSQVTGWIFPCNSTMPAFSVIIGAKNWFVPGSYLEWARVGTIGSVPYCYGGLQSSNGLPFNILGDVFLKTVYAIFDVGKARVGFAAQR